MSALVAPRLEVLLRRLLLTICFPALAACSALDLVSPDRSTQDNDIDEFVGQQLLKIRAVDTLMHVADHDVVVFRVVYGDPVPDNMPCIGSCPPTYPQAWGLKYDQKIGWLSGSLPDSERIRFFAVSGEDHYLFTAEFFIALGAADPILLEQTFKPMLVRNLAIPLSALRLIGEGLYSWINPPLAELLLENPRARASRDLLLLIANLPVFQGDAYREVRLKAQQLIGQPPA
jgi:hypothetical protein